jgi:hypothetical protein
MTTIDLGRRTMAAVVGLGLVILVAAACFDRDVYTATVVSKEKTVREDGAPEYLIHTTLANGRARTFKYVYYYAHSELPVPDLGAELEEGITYHLSTQGVRVPRTFIYEKITGGKEVRSR